MKKTALLYCRVLLFAAAVCCSKKIVAQIPATYSYQFYNSSHGLPSSEIKCLAKDSKGFLWIGTSSGLSMYDGYNFTNYTYTKENEMIGFVNVIRKGINNRLWIGSDAGLFCYENNELKKISAASPLPQGINDILPEEDDNIWLATENGPVHFNAKDADISGRKKILLTDFILPQWDQKNKIIEERQALLISKANDGAIFIAQNNNLFRLWNNKLELMHATLGRDRIMYLFPVSKSIIYFDAVETELNKVEDGMATDIPFEKFNQPTVGAALPGSWYVGTRGVFYFHPQTGTASVFIKLEDKYVVWATAALEDNGFLWLVSTDGLIKFKRSVFTSYAIQTPSGYNDYYSVAELKNGTLLLGANRGMVFNKEGNIFHLKKDKLVPQAEIKALYEDDRGWLWAATGYQGLAVIRNGKTERFDIENGLHDNTLHQFVKTTKGQLYVVGDYGMSEIIVTDDNNISFKKYLYEPNTTRAAKFFSAIESPDGTIWIGGEEGIFYLRNDSLHQFSLNRKQLYVNFLIKDKEANIWIAAAGEGILKCAFNKKNELEIVTRFSENDGLNTSHYLTLLADRDNNIWAGSSKGISVIGQQGKYKDRILNFDESDGFIKGGYSYIRLLQASDSSIWAATSLGFISFKPRQLLPSDAAPLVYITAIRQIKNKELLPEKYFSQYAEKNKFSYSNNSFNFKFTALDYANPENIRYYYKIDGLDTNWANSGGLRSISFENLSPGHYSFRVKALNSKGQWSRQDAVYSFSITSPFWKRWWFISACIISLLVAGVYLFKRRERGMKTNLLAKEKEMEVIKLNHDLAASKLTALRTQMNPHFIFNALNSVQQYILQGNVVEANKYLSKFSKLQREILHCSNQNFISLEKEIEILNSYLQLEQLRFGENFTYDINMTDEIDPAEIKIPPMILQPFAENAIWHGLMPKQGNRSLTIHFDLYTDDILLATIRDNGIGRDASGKLKQNNGGNITQHESKGMSMVYQRLQLLQQQYEKAFEVAVSDVTDVNGMVQGTQVALKIFIGNK